MLVSLQNQHKIRGQCTPQTLRYLVKIFEETGYTYDTPRQTVTQETVMKVHLIMTSGNVQKVQTMIRYR